MNPVYRSVLVVFYEYPELRPLSNKEAMVRQGVKALTTKMNSSPVVGLDMQTIPLVLGNHRLLGIRSIMCLNRKPLPQIPWRNHRLQGIRSMTCLSRKPLPQVAWRNHRLWRIRSMMCMNRGHLPHIASKVQAALLTTNPQTTTTLTDLWITIGAIACAVEVDHVQLSPTGAR